MTKEEIAGLAEAFKKMLEGGIGEDLPDMPQGGERRGLSSQEAIDQLQMGTWRLKGLMDPPFEALESQIEGMWRELLRDELSLFPMPQELKYCDSLDPNHEWPSSYRDADWPQRGEPAYPRMQLENRCYESRVFRRLHMELVHRQDSIQVIHCVMFPRLEFDLPILSMDMVGKGGGPISLAVIDPCPVSLNRSLPQQYYATVKELQERYGMATNRATPEWGKAIFSDLCVILRPQGPEDVSNFLKYAIALTRVHLQLSKLITPVTQNRDRRLAEIREAHARYSAKQLENDKTTRVLEAGFGKEFCNRYMRTVVFDEVDDLATA